MRYETPKSKAIRVFGRLTSPPRKTVSGRDIRQGNNQVLEFILLFYGLTYEFRNHHVTKKLSAVLWRFPSRLFYSGYPLLHFGASPKGATLASFEGAFLQDREAESSI